MIVSTPYAAPQYTLDACVLHRLHDPKEARTLSHVLAEMDPWRTLGYTPGALEQYLLRPDETLYRYVVSVESQPSGVVCVRYPWLRGAYLELIGLDAALQGRGLGRAVLQWIEEQARQAVPNVWVLVSAFNIRARTFYEQQGFCIIGTLQDFVRPGYDEILLRKVVL